MPVYTQNMGWRVGSDSYFCSYDELNISSDELNTVLIDEFLDLVRDPSLLVYMN